MAKNHGKESWQRIMAKNNGNGPKRIIVTSQRTMAISQMQE